MSALMLDRALLVQRIEFLEIELREARAREETLKGVNQSLLVSLHSQSLASPIRSIQEKTIAELGERNRTLEKELKSSQRLGRQRRLEFDDEVRKLSLENKELGITIRELRVNTDTLIQQLKEDIRQKSLKMQIRKKSHEKVVEQKNQEVYGIQQLWSEKLRNAQDILERTTQKYEEDLNSLKQSYEETISQLRDIYAHENSLVRSQFAKVRSKTSIFKQNQTSDSSVRDLKAQLAEKTDEISTLRAELSSALSQNQRIDVDLDLAALELKSLKADSAPAREQKMLKTEISGLIGKLLRTKDQILSKSGHSLCSESLDSVDTL